MLREDNSQLDCKTWQVRDAKECYSEGRKPIDCKWVYEVKLDNTTGKMTWWKSRIVARGDQMIYGQDFLETYAGVCRHTSLRLLLALAALLGWILTGADVSTAYLHAPLRGQDVWMRPPKGFPSTTSEGRPALLLLKMALYGLRQSAREWAITLIAWLLAWEYEKGTPTFVRSDTDPYMFIWNKQPLVFWFYFYGWMICLWHIAVAR
jgi:hypothetical protein